MRGFALRFARKFICSAIIGFLIISMPAFAWNTYTHRALWQAALENTDLSECDKSQISKIKKQAPVLPDRGGPKSSHNFYKQYYPAMEKVNEILKDVNNE